MTEEEFETRLMELIGEAQIAGTDNEDILTALECQMYAVKDAIAAETDPTD
jgi:hypothetical protein